MVSAYQEFVKKNMASMPKSMSAKEKMVAIGKLWKQQKDKGNKQVKGGDFFSDAILPKISMGLFGGELPKKKQGRKKRVKGEGFLSDAIGALGLGLPEKEMKKGKKSKKPKQSKQHKIKGGVISAAGLPIVTGAGMKKEKPMKIKLSNAITGHNIRDSVEYNRYQVKGSGFFDSFVKGLTLPFRVASNIPLPGLQQIGQIGSSVADSLGV